VLVLAVPAPEFAVLGPFEMRAGSEVLAAAPRRVRLVLALLVANANRVVPLGELVDAVWEQCPPPDAERTVRTYLSLLRTALRASMGPAAADLIVTRSPGYLLRVNPAAVDSARFERLAADGQRALRSGRPEVASRTLSAALALWRGRPYAEFDAWPLRAEAVRLEQARLIATEDRIEADLALGSAAGLVAELEGLTRRHPTHERLWAQLLTALYRAGRQTDALAAFRRVRETLVAEYGVEPSPDLFEIHQRILAQDTRLLPARAARATVAPRPSRLSSAPTAAGLGPRQCGPTGRARRRRMVDGR
jgi:DNA-binding SARP family transcriptional activator